MSGRRGDNVAPSTRKASQYRAEYYKEVRLENLILYLESLELISPFHDPLVQGHIQDVHQRFHSIWTETLAIASDSNFKRNSDKVISNKSNTNASATIMSQEQAQIIFQTMQDDCFLEDYHSSRKGVKTGENIQKDGAYILLQPNFFDIVAVRNALIRHDRDGKTFFGQQFKNAAVAHLDNLCNYYMGLQPPISNDFTSAADNTPLPLSKNSHLVEALHILRISIEFTIPSLHEHSSFLIKRKQLLERKRFDMKRKQTEMLNRYSKEFALLGLDFIGLLSSTNESNPSFEMQIYDNAKKELTRQLEEDVPKMMQSKLLKQIMDYHSQMMQFLQHTIGIEMSAPLPTLRNILAKSVELEEPFCVLQIKDKDGFLKANEIVDELVCDISELVCFLTQRLVEVDKGGKDISPCSSQVAVEDIKQALDILKNIGNVLTTGKIPMLIKVFYDADCRKRLVQRLTLALDEMRARRSSLEAVDGEIEIMQGQQNDIFRSLQLHMKRSDLLRENVAKEVTKMLKTEKAIRIL
jgi:hypothetical protein